MCLPTPSIDRETVSCLVAVLRRLDHQETNPNRKELLSAAIDRLWECYDGPQFEVSHDTVTASDVETAYAFLDEHGPTRTEAQTYRDEHGHPHPNRPFNHSLELVDTAARYRTGCLPSFRTWTAKYSHEGTVIAERTYDYEDSIKLAVVIDEVRYEATATERAADGTVHLTVTERPFRSDIDVYIHQYGYQAVQIEARNGPNVATETEPVTTLEAAAALDVENTAATGVIVTEPLEDVVAFVETQGWAYETNHAQPQAADDE